jgi:hypothetical protein
MSIVWKMVMELNGFVENIKLTLAILRLERYDS